MANYLYALPEQGFLEGTLGTEVNGEFTMLVSIHAPR